MKGLTPKPEYMHRLLDDIAGFGYNYLLVEFEDKFPYRNYSFMTHPAVWTREELKSLDSAKLRVIPLLQCAGHLDYLLKHPEMRHLRHRSSIYQWDMSRPETFAVWREMAEEILEIYPDCQYFHIGADEPELKSEEDFAAYLGHVERCIDYLKGKGKKVIMWYDFFRKHDPEQVKPLLRKVIVQVWQYYTLDETMIERLLHAGAEIWGASRIQNDGTYRGMSSQIKVRRNADDWTRVNAKYHLEGHTGTIWGRVQSLSPLCASLPQSMYMIAYLGKSLNTGKIPDRLEFGREIAQWFGDPELDIAAVAEKFQHDPDFAATLLRPVPCHNDIMEIWTLLNDLDGLFLYMDRCFGTDFAMLDRYRSGDAPPQITKNYSDGVRIFRERAEEMKKRIDDVLGKYFPQSLLDEFKQERFDALLELNEKLGEELVSAARKYHEKYD